jgi:demethoxyubiquinone hydroxylase (CLK1/Coq7/Cat5 family)
VLHLFRAPLRHHVQLMSSSSSARVPSSDSSGTNFGYLRGADVKRKAETDEMLRVDHAGEVGAVEIYRGQAWVLKGTSVEGLLRVRSSVSRRFNFHLRFTHCRPHPHPLIAPPRACP